MYRQQARYTKPCTICGEPITARKPSILAKQRYCSRACYHKDRWVTKDCVTCGKAFSGYVTSMRDREHCSAPCAGMVDHRGGEVTLRDPAQSAPPGRYAGRRSCVQCGSLFHPRSERFFTNNYCSRACFYASRRVQKTCEGCGKPFYVVQSKDFTRFCSRACFRVEERHATVARSGYRRVTTNGYIEVFLPDHPATAGRPYKYYAEHRLVMEQLLGRPLESHENVHHRDGNKSNNAESNLELWAVNQPPGQANANLNYILTLLRCMREAGLKPPAWPNAPEANPLAVPLPTPQPAEQLGFLLPQPEGTH